MRNGLDELVRVFSDPLIVWPGQDGEQLLGQWREVITVERLARAIKAHQQQEKIEFATLTEAALYLSTASLGFPFGHEWFQVYRYCFTQMMGWVGKEVPEELRLDRLSGWEETEYLRPFLRWLRRRQDELWKQRQEERLKLPAVHQATFTF